jgi:Tfp pilus assembly protein PilO
MTDHSIVFSIVTALVLLTIVSVFGMKYFSAARQTKALPDNQEAYRKLAEIATTARTASAASLSALQSDFAEMKSRLASIEKVLSEV